MDHEIANFGNTSKNISHQRMIYHKETLKMLNTPNSSAQQDYSNPKKILRSCHLTSESLTKKKLYNITSSDVNSLVYFVISSTLKFTSQEYVNSGNRA